MICQCGGQLSLKRSDRNGVATLRYAACASCGRCGRWALEVDGRLVSRGETARRVYQDARALEQFIRRARA
ncbi:MAG: hypothetical protein JJU27_14005 [Gammaproteobacteria bacterium]|nr:hypothetical protein [Gammaproteobacteria bacterium]